MTAIVSRERARATWLTGAAGLLMLAAAFIMMVAAAPSHAHPRPHGPVATHSSPGDQLLSRLSTAAPPRTGPAGPPARSPDHDDGPSLLP
jgi:hypothetical protein